MVTTPDMPQPDPGEVAEFLAKSVPFTELEQDKIQELSHRFVLRQFFGETTVFRQDVDAVEHFYLIYPVAA